MNTNIEEILSNDKFLGQHFEKENGCFSIDSQVIAMKEISIFTGLPLTSSSILTANKYVCAIGLCMAALTSYTIEQLEHMHSIEPGINKFVHKYTGKCIDDFSGELFGYGSETFKAWLKKNPRQKKKEYKKLAYLVCIGYHALMERNNG